MYWRVYTWKQKKSMTLNTFRWLKGWSTRRSRRLHPIDDRVANARNFVGREIDDVPNFFPAVINQRVALNNNLIQRVEISDCLEIKCCSICLEDFETSIDHQVVRLPCLHIFHDTCIAKWLVRSYNVNCSCPLCRSQILPLVFCWVINKICLCEYWSIWYIHIDLYMQIANTCRTHWDTRREQLV